MWRGISVYIVESFEDILELSTAGIYDFSPDLDECANCGMVVALVGGLDQVLPCVVVSGLTSGEAWPCCLDCASPLLYPNDWVPEN